jgi:type IV pilus biogenesis protein CpaD/CtpE
MKLLLLLCPMILFGCTSSANYPNHGDVVSNNADVQVVNPDASNPSDSIVLDGPKSQQVMDSYRKDTGKTSNNRILVDISSGGSASN